MRMALGQFNAVVGDIDHNVERIKSFYHKAIEQGSDLMIFPELAVCGYPPEDLLLKKHFIDDNLKAVEAIASSCNKKTLIVGFAEKSKNNDCCYNAAAIIQDGTIRTVYRKRQLPNFGVFDEKRYFCAGDKPLIINVDGCKVAVTICRDIWELDRLEESLEECGKVDLVANISASPFCTSKIQKRINVVKACAAKLNSAVAYCNLVGAQDEIVFDGRSMVVDSAGELKAIAKAFEQDLLIADLVVEKQAVKIESTAQSKDLAFDVLGDIYQAIVLGTRDYFQKNGFKKALIGLSGGIDSSIVAAIAVEALGSENVVGVTMPSRFNSQETKNDAVKLADNLGIKCHTVEIESILKIFSDGLNVVKGWDEKGLAYENLQARIRGSILMSLSNQFAALVLTTGNKSETAVGYSTLYGDTAGGFAMIKDLPKTLVYKLSRYINEKAGRELIPGDVITRPPSAELRENQKDSDSLPDYELLDKILYGYVECDKSAEDLIAAGFEKDQVKRIIALVDRNEYKRRQSPPGVKITAKAFGKDRRLPITNGYRDN